MISELGPQLYNVTIDQTALRERVSVEVKTKLAGETGLSRDDRQRLAAEITDDILGYGPLERLIADDSITEIMVNGPNEIWIERQGRLYETTSGSPTSRTLRRIINKIVSQVGRRIDESSPMVDARLPDGASVNAIIAPLSLSGPLLTIRKFSKKRLTLEDMVNLGTFSQESVDFLTRCVEAQLNILISGGTGSGKTTLLNVLSRRSRTPSGSSRSRTPRSCSSIRSTSCGSRPARPTSRARARSPSATSSATPCACAPTASSSASARRRGARHAAGDEHRPRRLARPPSTPTRRATRSRRLETMVLMAGYRPAGARDPRADVIGAGPDRAPRAHGRRHAPCHLRHRGAADGVGRRHAAERFEFKVESIAPDQTITGKMHPTGLRPTFLAKFEKRGIELPTSLFTMPPPALQDASRSRM